MNRTWILILLGVGEFIPPALLLFVFRRHIETLFMPKLRHRIILAVMVTALGELFLGALYFAAFFPRLWWLPILGALLLAAAIAKCYRALESWERIGRRRAWNDDDLLVALQFLMRPGWEVYLTIEGSQLHLCILPPSPRYVADCYGTLDTAPADLFAEIVRWAGSPLPEEMVGRRDATGVHLMYEGGRVQAALSYL